MGRARYQPPPVIIKTIRKVEDGHHSHTAWKVAYADFVTAMMAFFLLLWLYSTLTQKQKIDVAKYFTPTPGIVGATGIGAKGGKDGLEEGSAQSDDGSDGLVKKQIQFGQAPVFLNRPLAESVADAESTGAHNDTPYTGDEPLDQVFMAVSDAVRQMLQKNPDSIPQDNVIVDRLPDSISISLVNDPRWPVFENGKAEFTDMGKRQIKSLGNLLALLGRGVTITSHMPTNRAAYNNSYSHWELSIDRANAARRLMGESKLDPRCVLKVDGLSDYNLLIPNEPTNPRNQRITITISKEPCKRELPAE